jgi:4-amino-4-deoxy-L-arabinose transferase-like glycosyltransferase
VIDGSRPTAGPDPAAAPGEPGGGARWDRYVLPALLALAAVMRFPNLAARGTWEADQGHDMLTLRALVQDGIVPLLGPPTSIGDVHHGAWYYYLLSPAAALTGGDSPLAVVALIALAGVAAVGVVWWLARQVGGPVAGAAAGLLAALSAAAIDESTFIWNPNLIALSSALALAGTWRAWSGGDRRWWLLAAVGTAVTMQCHILGVALLPVVAVPFIADARRRSLGRVALGVVAVFAAAYLPLLVNELTTGGSELRAALDYLAGGRTASDVAIPVRFAIAGLRVLSWPLTGLITVGFVAAAVASAAVIAIAVWRSRAGGDDQLAARWLGLGLLWSTAFLTLAAPSLASVVPGLPNDHYHAFADPMVFTLVGLGAAALTNLPVWRAGAGQRVGAVIAAVGVVALLGWNVTHLPPATNPDGGFPAGEAAAERVEATLANAGISRDAVVRVRSLPTFKSTEAMAYPLLRAGLPILADMAKGTAPGSTQQDPSPGGLVLLCDDRFHEAIGGHCDGPAEGTVTPDGGGAAWGPLLDRFEAAPDRFVSVYGPATTP